MISDASSIVAGASITIEVGKGRNLVAKDCSLLRKAKTSDPYVIIHYNQREIGRTKTIYKNCLSPDWQNEKFEINFNIKEAQELILEHKTAKSKMIEFCIMDEDLITSSDSMGIVQVAVPQLGGVLRTESWYRVTTGIPKTREYCKNATGELQIVVTTIVRQMYKLHRGNVLTINQFPQKECHLTFGLSWDIPKEINIGIDLDSCCVAVDRDGNILMDETVYYGNLHNPNRSIGHSGDENTGTKVGDDEYINIALNLVPSNVLALYILLFVASPEQTFQNVTSAQVRIIGQYTGNGICRFVPSEIAGSSTALFLVRIARNESNGIANDWMITPIEESDNCARDFGSLIPELKGYTRDLIPSIVINPRERIAIMRKGGTIRVADYVPSHVVPEWLTFGLAWDITDGVAIDLDASAILLDEHFNLVDAVYFRQIRSKDGSVKHSGDNRLGDAIGDDEMISFALAQVPENVAFIGLVINSFSGQELDDVAKASCHLFDPNTNTDVANYKLSNCAALNGHTALVMGCLYRSPLVEGGSPTRDWYLRIIAEPAQGKTVNDNVDELQRFLQNNPPQKVSTPPEPEIVLNAMPDPILVEEEEIVIPIPEEEIYVLMN